MRVFIAVLVLIFGFQSWTKADDIRDFQIEGISIGDSALNHFSKSEFRIFSPYKNDKYIGGYKKLNNKDYDAIQFMYLKNDSSITIENITGKIYCNKNIQKCKDLMKEIKIDIDQMFSGAEKTDVNKKHTKDPNGKSYIWATNYVFKNGDVVQISVTDWHEYKDHNGKIKNHKDELKVGLSLLSYVDFVRNEAYK